MPFQSTHVSVVVPALNEEKLIGKCLESLRNQTVPCEIIVVDNGSRDQTPEIADKYADKVLVEPDLSITKLRERGVEASTGDIIATTDADTVCPPTWLEKLLDPFRDTYVVATGGPVKPLKTGVSRGVYTQLLSSAVSLGLLLGSNMAYRRSAYEKVGGYPKTYRAEDWTLSLRLADVGKVVYNPEAVVYTDVPYSRQLEAAGIAISFGLLGLGAATDRMALTGLGAGYLGSELASMFIETHTQGFLHHSQLAVLGLGVSALGGRIPESVRDLIVGGNLGMLYQHYVREDMEQPVWRHVNGSLLAGVTLLLASR